MKEVKYYNTERVSEFLAIFYVHVWKRLPPNIKLEQMNDKEKSNILYRAFLLTSKVQRDINDVLIWQIQCIYSQGSPDNSEKASWLNCPFWWRDAIPSKLNTRRNAESPLIALLETKQLFSVYDEIHRH